MEALFRVLNFLEKLFFCLKKSFLNFILILNKNIIQ